MSEFWVKAQNFVFNTLQHTNECVTSLILYSLLPQSLSVVSSEADLVNGEIDIDDEDDGVWTISEGSSQVLQYEYHILYSCSYSTPVLYFRAFTLGESHGRLSLHTRPECFSVHLCGVLTITHLSVTNINGWTCICIASSMSSQSLLQCLSRSPIHTHSYLDV